MTTTTMPETAEVGVRRPVRTSLALFAVAVSVSLAGAGLVDVLVPGSDPLLRRLPAVLVLAAMALLVARRVGWREVAAGGPSTWRSVGLLVAPTVVVLLPVAWGWAPDTATLAWLVLGYAATAVYEELWFRGVMLRAALPLGPVRGAVLTSALFGAAHLSNMAFGASPAVTVAQAVGSGLGGFGYAVLRQRTDALWLLVVLHGLGDLLLRTSALHGGVLALVLVGHDTAFFVCGLLAVRGLRRDRPARAGARAGVG